MAVKISTGEFMEELLSFISTYKLIAITLIIFLEYACFPVSSEIVLPFSGAVCAMEDTPFIFLLVLSTIAGITGTLVCYALGRFGGNIILNCITGKFPKTKPGIESSRQKFENLGGMSVFFARMIPLCRTYIAFIAGAAVLPLKTYIIYSAGGIIIWNCILTGIGYLLGDNWHIAATFYSCYKNIIIPVALLITVVIVFTVRNKRAAHEKGTDS